MTDLPRLAHPLPDGVSDTFVCPCIDCGETLHVVGGVQQPHEHRAEWDDGTLAAHAWWAGYEAASARFVKAES